MPIAGERINVAKAKEIVAARLNNVGEAVARFLKLRLGNKVQKVKYVYEFDESKINKTPPLLICVISFLEDRGMEFLKKKHELFAIKVEIKLDTPILIESKEYTTNLRADYELIDENVFRSLCTLIRNRWRKEFGHDLEDYEEYFREGFAKLRKESLANMRKKEKK